MKLKTLKVASADLTDHYLHEFLSKTKKKVIISTGMSNLNEISETLKIYRNTPKKFISLLHCVSNYPCLDSSLNLNCLELLSKFKYKIGFSDHTKGYLSSALAIAKGAKILEKHITLDNNLPGPDHKASLNLKDFKNFIDKIRKTETILGSKIKKLQSEEKEMLNVSRKSLYFKENFIAGKKIKKNDMIPLRPYTGMKISDYKKIQNKKLKYKVKKNQKVSFKNFI
jgi:sialic acid synthase SpsE